jgi:uncharacterized protein (DUF2147 family)
MLMKRFGYLAVLMMLSSSAHAGSFSFMLHGHRILVERPRHCFSRSCLSVTVPGLHGAHPDSGADDIAGASDTAPAKPAAALPALSTLPSPSPSPAPVQARPAPAPPLLASPPAAKSQNVALATTTPQAVPSPAPVAPALRAEPPNQASSTEKLPAMADPPPATASQQRPSEAADTPLGDWQTEGNKGLVRIEACGAALCGYVVDAATNAKSEIILINMRPKGATDWTGTIVSRASDSTYYAKMALTQSNTLRVEACALGRFFCSGNDWSRVVVKPQAWISSRPIAQPSS